MGILVVCRQPVSFLKPQVQKARYLIIIIIVTDRVLVPADAFIFYVWCVVFCKLHSLVTKRCFFSSFLLSLSIYFTFVSHLNVVLTSVKQDLAEIREISLVCIRF